MRALTLARETKFIAGPDKRSRDGAFSARGDESAMNDRPVWRRRINQLPRLEYPQDSAGAPDVSGISVRQQ